MYEVQVMRSPVAKASFFGNSPHVMIALQYSQDRLKSLSDNRSLNAVRIRQGSSNKSFQPVSMEQDSEMSQ